MKYSGINLTKHVQDFYTENCKTLMKELKENLSKWKDILFSLIWRLNSVKMSDVPH